MIVFGYAQESTETPRTKPGAAFDSNGKLIDPRTTNRKTVQQLADEIRAKQKEREAQYEQERLQRSLMNQQQLNGQAQPATSSQMMISPAMPTNQPPRPMTPPPISRMSREELKQLIKEVMMSPDEIRQLIREVVREELASPHKDEPKNTGGRVEKEPKDEEKKSGDASIKSDEVVG